jgi:hypothetical protein
MAAIQAEVKVHTDACSVDSALAWIVTEEGTGNCHAYAHPSVEAAKSKASSLWCCWVIFANNKEEQGSGGIGMAHATIRKNGLSFLNSLKAQGMPNGDTFGSKGAAAFSMNIFQGVAAVGAVAVTGGAAGAVIASSASSVAVGASSASAAIGASSASGVGGTAALISIGGITFAGQNNTTYN